MANLEKIGRNDPCPCGSGRKYKKCCLRAAPAQRLRQAPAGIVEKALRQFREHENAERERRARYGDIRPQISAELQGYRFVTVGSKLHYSNKWKYFTDFLLDHVSAVFGKDWGDAELAKPEQKRHPVVQWWSGGRRHMKAKSPQPDGRYTVVPNGLLAAYLAFAYDLYTIGDNSRLDDLLLQRLKNIDQFQGARHELFAEATCLRAGYTIERENERDGARRHAEFTATHRTTGQQISVEAKSRHRPGILGRPGVPPVPEKMSLRFGELLNDALRKNPPHPLAVFIDTNLPTRAADRLYGFQRLSPPVPSPTTSENKTSLTITFPPTSPLMPSRIMSALLDRVCREHGGSDPYALLVFTNHPHHYAAPDETDPRKHLLSIMPQKSPAGVVHAEAVLALHNAANLYGNIPNEFPKRDG